MTTPQKLTTEENIKIIKQFYLGLNQNHIDSLLRLFDTNVIRIEFEGFPNSGTYRGIAELREHFISGRSTWLDGGCEPIEFFCNLDKVVVVVHVKVRLKKDLKWIDGFVADGFSLKDGLVTEFHSFMEKEKAFEWAGIYG